MVPDQTSGPKSEFQKGATEDEKLAVAADADIDPDEADGRESQEDEDPEYVEQELQEYADQINSRLTKCALGQPYDEGEVVWLDGHTSLNDLMDTVGVPEDEDYREQVAEMVRCPCGDEHGLWDEVGIKSEGELRYEELLDEWYEKHAGRLESFYEHLEKFPYLGASHPLGSEIRDNIEKFPVTTVEDDIWYRARRVADGKIMTPEDFSPPDPTKVAISEGRFNHHGQKAFYLANDKDGAALECIAEGESMAWVQAFRIKKLANVLDLSLEEDWADEDLPVLALGLMHSGAIRRFVKRTFGWKPEYFIPRYVADCAREKGLNGILFKSVRHFRDNLVLFSQDPNIVVAEGEPELVKVQDWKAEWKFRNPDEFPKIQLWPSPATMEDVEEL